MKKNSMQIENKTYEFFLSFDELSIQPECIETKIGSLQEGVQNPFSAQIRKSLLSASTTIKIRGGYCIFNKVSLSNDRNILKINDIAFLLGKIIGNQLKYLERVAVIVCTIGSEISHLTKKLMAKGKIFQAYTVDTIGSVSVERATDLIQEKLSTSVKHQGENITNRFSPGYCGWDVSAQQDLFSLLPNNFCGVTLTDTAFMKPLKSISGIVGIGKNVRRLDYPCNVCDRKDCLRRKSNCAN